MKTWSNLMPALLMSMAVLFPMVMQAQHKLDSLETALKNIESDSARVLQEIHFSRQLHRYKHDSKKEYSYAQNAISTALALQDTLLYARALDNMGLLYRYHQQYSEAIPLHTKAFLLVKNLDVEPLYKMIFANNAGVAGRYSQTYDLSVKYYLEALAIAEKTRNLQNIAIACNGLGNALGNIPGQEEIAMHYYKRSLKAEEKRGNTLGMAMNYLSISDYYIEESQFDKAHEYLGKLLKINQKRDDDFGIAITHEFYGKCYFKEGKFGKAHVHYTKSLAGFTKLDNVLKEAELLGELGELSLQNRNREEAIAYYKQSLRLAANIDAKALIMINNLQLSKIYEAKGEFADALSYLKKSQQYKDSINLIEQKTTIAALNKKYNIEKKESRIQLLEKNERLQKSQLDTQGEKLKYHRTLTLLMGLGLVSILLILFLQYRNTKIKKKANKLLQQREDERVKAVYERNLAQAEMLASRLKVNPHFLFNCLNAIKFLIQSEQNKMASKYLVVFSHFIRKVLETSSKNVISLKEELTLIEEYLNLEKRRFDHGFSFLINGCDEKELEDIMIPPLLLQPYVENAIWHGLLPSEKEKKILIITTNRSQTGIEISIDDNGVGREANSGKRNAGRKSMGMQITKERIDLFNKIYNRKIEWLICDKVDEAGVSLGTKITLTLSNNVRVNDINEPIMLN